MPVVAFGLEVLTLNVKFATWNVPLGAFDIILGSRPKTIEMTPAEFACAIEVTLIALLSLLETDTSLVSFTSFGSKVILILAKDTGLSEVIQTPKLLSGGSVPF